MATRCGAPTWQARRRRDPVRLRVIGEVAAGHVAIQEVGPGTAVRILTGAMVPLGADAVVRVEDTDAAEGVADLPDSVGVRVAVAAGTAIRPAGSDVREGDLVLAAGQRPGAASYRCPGGCGLCRGPGPSPTPGGHPVHGR